MADIEQDVAHAIEAFLVDDGIHGWVRTWTKPQAIYCLDAVMTAESPAVGDEVFEYVDEDDAGVTIFATIFQEDASDA